MEPRCVSIKTDGHRCTRVHGLGSIRCTQHTTGHNRKIAQHGAQPEGTCEMIIQGRPRRWCGQACAEGSSICQLHVNMFVRRHQREEQQRQEQHRLRNAVTVYEVILPRPTWRAVIDDVLTHEEWTPRFKYDVAFIFFIRHGGIHIPGFFGMYWAWVMGGRHGPEPQPEQLMLAPPPAYRPPQNLGQIAADRQNVHTAVVSQQTNKSVDKLLEIAGKISATKRYRTPDWVAAKWLVESYGAWAKVRPVVEDMLLWYNRDTCRAVNDRLYHRLLDGLYEHIRSVEDKEMKSELWKRLFEECNEAVSMCCEGHISRLCNVLVGFDETFAPPVSVGEILQTKLAAIFLLDISTDAKREQAIQVMNELNVPEIERSVWLDAF
jgi:hypothetical protein